MSEENVDRMRQSQAAFERGDKDAWCALVHPDVEVVPIGDWPEGDIQGRDAAWDFFVTVEAQWEPGTYVFDEVSDGGDRIAARMRRHLRGKSSGVEVEYDYWVVFTFRDGMFARTEWFEDRQQASARRACGQAIPGLRSTNALRRDASPLTSGGARECGEGSEWLGLMTSPDARGT